jgi:hypothetical protein
MSQIVSGLVLAKIEEQIERLDHLLSLTPPDRLDWQPMPGVRPVGKLAGHLLECLAGFCATFYALAPDRLAHFARLREQPVNHRCEVEEARRRIGEYGKAIREGFATLTDADLPRLVPTVFVPRGEAVLTLLLGNLEHLLNHKRELFGSLKAMGVRVSTPDLYRFRA